MNATCQNAPIDTKQLLSGLHPFFTAGDKYLEEPEETLSKLDSIIALILACQDDKTREFNTNMEEISWGLLVARDLADETQRRIEALRNHSAFVWEETEKRLDACLLIPHHSINPLIE